MASFRKFPDLPYELRSEIWRLAIRPSAEGYSGIQYFSILHNNMPTDAPRSRCKRLAPPSFYKNWSEDRLTVFNSTIPGLNEEDKDEVNRSAYMWDAGLWTACWESRQIIMHHWKMDKWLEKRRGFFNEREMWEEHKDLCTTVNAPALYRGGGKQDWQLMVRPYRDAFYVDRDSLQEALKQPSHRLWNRYIIRDIVGYLPFCMGRYACQEVRNLIFDFDPNWVKDMPSDGNIFNEDSPRGWIANLFVEMEDSYYPTQIWLIDRSLNQAEDGDQHVAEGAPRVFYNCDEEFVDVGMGGYERYDPPWDCDPRDEDAEFPKIYQCKEKDLSAALAKEKNGLAGWFVWMLAERGGDVLTRLNTSVRCQSPFEDLHAEMIDYVEIKPHLGILGYRNKGRDV